MSKRFHRVTLFIQTNVELGGNPAKWGWPTILPLEQGEKIELLDSQECETAEDARELLTDML